MISKGETTSLKVDFSLENNEVRRQCKKIFKGLKDNNSLPSKKYPSKVKMKQECFR